MYKYQETKENWRKLNRDRVNTKRRERRLQKRQEKLKDKRCLLCEFPFTSKFAGIMGSRVYCEDCRERYPDGVRRDRWKRYWAKRTVTPQMIERWWKMGQWDKIDKATLKSLIHTGKIQIDKTRLDYYGFMKETVVQFYSKISLKR